MPSTAIKGSAAAALLVASATAFASATSQPPRYLTVPVLGLRVPLVGLKLEPFPDDLRATCSQIADDESYTGHVWIFGKARDAGSTYFILTGYFKRRTPDPERRPFETWENGSVFTIRNGKCGGDDAGDTFDVRDANADNDDNVPLPILRELARDLAVQTVRACGGADRLREEIKSQRIDFNHLPPELQEAFAPYFSR
ncbi:MAG TPA: hypothetical protein VFF16_14610 [Telluria sp.]|nr:hypothetical protein [Telluria sp.]